jgi:hypothetical protein
MTVRTIKNVKEFKKYNPKRTRPEHRRMVLIKTLTSEDLKECYYDANHDCFCCLYNDTVYYCYNRDLLKFWVVLDNIIRYYKKYD